MKKFYLLLGCSLLLQWSNNLSAQVLVSEDFSSATGSTPPSGWTNNDMDGGGNVWEFNNPGGRTFTLPISDPAAIFDSDNYGYDNITEDCALESPLFDASSASNPIFLSFDQYFDSNYGGAIAVEVWDGSAWVQVYASTTTSPNPEHVLLDITSDLNGASDAQVRFHWTGDYSMYWIVDNILVEEVSCIPVSDLAIDNQGVDFMDLSWTINGTETAWDMEYGTPGFTPGTGNELGAVTASSNPYTLSGLDPGTMYDVYVRANCGTSEAYWILVSGATDCAPISSFPWTNDIESMAQTDYGIVPYCWANENGDWLSDDGNNTGLTANSGTNFLAIYYGTNDHLWTPEFQLTAGRTYEFSFMWAGDGYSGWSGSAEVNGTQSSIGATVLGTPFVAPADNTSEDYERAFFCFTPDTSGTYFFGVKVSSSFMPYILRFDDFSVVERGSNAGTNGTLDACQIEGLVDLESIVTVNDELGNWTFSPNPSTIVNGNQFNPQFVPAGTVSVDYITYGCLVDTASALITIYPPSSAGTDGAITACKNEPINLFSGLGGTVNFGGDWYNPSNMPVPNGNVITGTFPGQYNYKYITGNGVCPDDTSSVVVTVTSCNWLSVDEAALEEMNLYPNPSTGLVYIESTFSAGTFKLDITDINGRTVETAGNTISSGTTTVNLSHVQKGTYFFKLSNDQAEKVYRVVIQ